MGLDHGPPNFCQKVWFLIMGTMVIIPIWVLIMYPLQSDHLIGDVKDMATPLEPP